MCVFVCIFAFVWLCYAACRALKWQITGYNSFVARQAEAEYKYVSIATTVVGDEG